MIEISGYVADYRGSDGVLCYGFGETEAIVKMRVNWQIAGVSTATKARMWDRITLRPVGPDDASEILEMLDTPY